MKNKLCHSNLLEFLEFVSESVNKGVPIDIFHLDLKKVFHGVPHRRLLSTVSAIIINGMVSQLIAKWWDGGKQTVVINGYCSERSGVLSGVP